jgi:hypothetical protein
VISVICFVWMHRVIQRTMRTYYPDATQRIE